MDNNEHEYRDMDDDIQIDVESSGETTRRSFLLKAAKVGFVAGLAHFVLLGGEKKAFAAVVSDCKTPPSNPDDCPQYTFPSDYCGTSNADVCSPNEETGDSCWANASLGQGSEDQCSTGKVEDDVCQHASAGPLVDYCPAPYTGDYDNCDYQGDPLGTDMTP